MTTQSKSEVLQEIKETLGQVPSFYNEFPDAAVGGFWALMRDFHLAETRIPTKYKELIGIAVSGATRCRYCTLFHTEVARLNGATDQEIAEASTMGAVTMAFSTFINAQQTDYETFRRETSEIISYVKKQSAKKAPATARPVQAHA